MYRLLLDELKVRKSDLLGKLTRLDELLEGASDVEDKAKKYFELKGACEELDNKAFQVQELSEKKHDLRSKLATMRSRLEVEVGHAKEAYEEKLEKSNKLTDVYSTNKRVKNLISVV